MNSEALFSMALGLQPPWQIKEINFSVAESSHHELYLRVGFSPGTRFPDDTGKMCPVHDTVERQWQHLSFLSMLVICIAQCLA